MFDVEECVVVDKAEDRKKFTQKELEHKPIPIQCENIYVFVNLLKDPNYSKYFNTALGINN